MNKTLILLLIMVFPALIISGQDQEWIVPKDQQMRLSTFSFTDSTSQLGEKLYQLNCTSCHGDPGKGNHANLDPIPPDPASEMIQQNLDGELYYKLWEGRGLMPSFKNILSPVETWLVISYLRTFNADYVQEIAKEIERKGYDGIIRILLTYLPKEQVVESEVIGIKDDGQEPIILAPVKLTAHRYFGGLTIDGIKNTDSMGMARFYLPPDLPGDSTGNIRFTASLTDLELYGTTQTDTTFLAGVPTHLPGLTEQRAMWNTIWKAPVWLLITYFSGVLAVWGTILYIVWMLRKIYLFKKEDN